MDRQSRSPRDRRLWTKDEDAILRREAEHQASTNGSITDWCAIATKLSGRTNKDCRKRWSKISGGVSKGSWSEAEDDRLRQAVAISGPRWTDVAREVHTRNADQCSKRWLHFLDPRLDRGKWSSEDDGKLMLAVAEFGTDWKRICLTSFPQRSATNVKNRYNNVKHRVSAEHRAPRSAAPSSSPGGRDSRSFEGQSPSTGSPAASVTGPPTGWIPGESSNSEFRSASYNPGNVRSDHVVSSVNAPYMDWDQMEEYFDTQAQQSATYPRQSHVYSNLPSNLPPSDAHLQWNHVFEQGDQSRQHAMTSSSLLNGQERTQVSNGNIQSHIPQYTLPSNVGVSPRQAPRGSPTAHGSPLIAPPWPTTTPLGDVQVKGKPGADAQGQRYSLLVDDVPPQTVQNLVSFLSGSELGYTLRLAGQSTAPRDSSATVEAGALPLQNESRSWARQASGAPTGGVRHTVRIEDLSLNTMQHLLEVLNASEMRAHARILG